MKHENYQNNERKKYDTLQQTIRVLRPNFIQDNDYFLYYR